MAGIYTPTVTNYPNGLVSIISTTGTSYDEIINSLGSYMYGVYYMHTQSSTNEQALEPLRFNQYDSNGNIQAYSQINAIDPFQKQTALNFDLSQKNIVLNGRTTLSTNMLPNQQIDMIFYIVEVAAKNLLSGENIFEEDAFYADYTGLIKENSSIPPDLNIQSINVVAKNPNNTAQPITPIPISVDMVPIVPGSIQKKKKENPTYWMYVLLGGLVVAYMINPSKK